MALDTCKIFVEAFLLFDRTRKLDFGTHEKFGLHFRFVILGTYAQYFSKLLYKNTIRTESQT